MERPPPPASAISPGYRLSAPPGEDVDEVAGRSRPAARDPARSGPRDGHVPQLVEVAAQKSRGCRLPAPRPAAAPGRGRARVHVEAEGGHPARAISARATTSAADVDEAPASGSLSAAHFTKAEDLALGLAGPGVEAVPGRPADEDAPEPAVEAPVGRRRGGEVEGRVGRPPALAVRRGEEPVGVGGCREGPALQGGGAERGDPVLARTGSRISPSR